jgi:hypothetical protein
MKRVRSLITDQEVDRCRALIERSGVAQWLETELVARHRRCGRPRSLSVMALLCGLLLLATDDRALHLSAVTEVLFCRISERARADLRVRGTTHDRRSFLARYRQVRYLFSAVASVMDPSGLVKNLRIDEDEFARRCIVVTEEDAAAARERLESFSGALLAASISEFGGDAGRTGLAYGLDATPVALFSRGPSRRARLCASDPDGGWYVRDGDHRDREDHKGRPTPRISWALEATVVTTASPDPGSLATFPNVVVAMVLGRPGVDPGGTAVRVLRGVVSRGFAPGPLGCDRAYSGALSENFHLPVRAMGFDLIVDYRIDQLGRQANSQGAVMVEGTWYCPSMPEALVNATIDLRAGRIDDATYKARIEARGDFALRRKSRPDKDGYERFICPAMGPHPKVRCEQRRTSLGALGKRTVPVVPLDPPAVCRQSAITIAPDVGRRFAQSFSFGSESWARHYATLRNTIEGWNGFAKDPSHEALSEPARRRVRGIAAQGIFITMLYVAANLRKIETYEEQLEQRPQLEARKRARRRRVSLKDYIAS